MSKLNWTNIQLYFTGDDYFRDVIREIEKATTEVLIESYMFNMDVLGLSILKALCAAQDRGVRVKILVDGIGSFNWLSQLQAKCVEQKIPLRVFHPLPLQKGFLKRLSWKYLRRALIIFRRMNKRDHRKIICIDQRILFLGSCNISQEHLAKFMGSKAWRDTGVRLEGPDILIARQAFFKTWNYARFGSVLSAALLWTKRSRIHQHPSRALRLNTRTYWRYFLLRDLNRRLDRARTRILITNAYFVPRRSVLRALRKAAKRGVYVALCLPAKTDVRMVRWAARSLYHRLLKDGVFIHEYQPSVLHAKTLIIDNWATVGSHNLNHRSLTHDLEIEAVIRDPTAVEKLIDQWHVDIEQSRRITTKEVGKWGWASSLLGRMAYWFRYWL